MTRNDIFEIAGAAVISTTVTIATRCAFKHYLRHRARKAAEAEKQRRQDDYTESRTR